MSEEAAPASEGGATFAPQPTQVEPTEVEPTEVEGVLTSTLLSAVQRHGSGAVLLCSFQKEESVLIDELVRIGGGSTPVRIVMIDTGVLFEETIQTSRELQRHFGIEVEVQDATGPWTGPEKCCSAAKVAALGRALQHATAWITGVRREQAPTRANAQLIERDEARAIEKYNPLAFWTEEDIWRRIHRRGLPYNILHDHGYDSIGCRPCTMPGRGRAGRWAGTEKTECGLHVPPQAMPLAAETRQD